MTDASLFPVSKRLLVLPVLCISLLAGCDSGGSSSTPPLLAAQPSSQILADAQGSTESRLVTGAVNDDKQSRWFCSFFNGNTYISRSSINFYDDGHGQLNTQDTTWAVSKENEVTLTSTDWQLRFTEIIFSTRVSANDHFDATVGSDSQISCDWSGEPRPGSTQFSDAGDTIGLLSGSQPENEFVVEGLLITALNSDRNYAVWKCEVHENGGVIDFLEYSFYSRNEGNAVLDFIWLPLQDDAIRLVFTEASYDLTDVLFKDDFFEEFSANDSRGYSINCTWSGPSRTTTF